MPCSECQKRLYDLETGQPRTYLAGPNKEERYYDGPDFRPPCMQGYQCPKVSPQEEKRHVLSDANYKVWSAWRRRRSGEKFVVDRLLAEFFSVIDDVYADARKRWEVQKLAISARLRRQESGDE